MIHPIIAYILSLGVSVCISIIFLIPTYYSWTHNAEEYWEWYLDQITPIFRRVWTIFWEQEIWGSYTLWSARLIGPIGFLMGLTGVIYALYEILNFFFSGN